MAAALGGLADPPACGGEVGSLRLQCWVAGAIVIGDVGVGFSVIFLEKSSKTAGFEAMILQSSEALSLSAGCCGRGGIVLHQRLQISLSAMSTGGE